MSSRVTPSGTLQRRVLGVYVSPKHQALAEWAVLGLDRQEAGSLGQSQDLFHGIANHTSIL